MSEEEERVAKFLLDPEQKKDAQLLELLTVALRSNPAFVVTVIGHYNVPGKQTSPSPEEIESQRKSALIDNLLHKDRTSGEALECVIWEAWAELGLAEFWFFRRLYMNIPNSSSTQQGCCAARTMSLREVTNELFTPGDSHGRGIDGIYLRPIAPTQVSIEFIQVKGGRSAMCKGSGPTLATGRANTNKGTHIACIIRLMKQEAKKWISCLEALHPDVAFTPVYILYAVGNYSLATAKFIASKNVEVRILNTKCNKQAHFPKWLLDEMKTNDKLATMFTPKRTA